MIAQMVQEAVKVLMEFPCVNMCVSESTCGPHDVFFNVILFHLLKQFFSYLIVF